MTHHAKGAFDIKMTPLEDKLFDDPYIGRMMGDKQLHGDLEGTGKGQMFYAKTAVAESSAYVAIEKIAGTLNGRKGTFIFQHSATMTRGVPQLSITVVPDSGTGELTGIAGKFTINIDNNGKHSYEFDYTLPDSH